MVLGCQLVFGSHSSFSSEMPVPYINFLKKERRDFAFSLLMLIVSALFFVFHYKYNVIFAKSQEYSFTISGLAQIIYKIFSCLEKVR